MISLISQKKIKPLFGSLWAPLKHHFGCFWNPWVRFGGPWGAKGALKSQKNAYEICFESLWARRGAKVSQRCLQAFKMDPKRSPKRLKRSKMNEHILFRSLLHSCCCFSISVLLVYEICVPSSLKIDVFFLVKVRHSMYMCLRATLARHVMARMAPKWLAWQGTFWSATS